MAAKNILNLNPWQTSYNAQTNTISPNGKVETKMNNSQKRILSNKENNLDQQQASHNELNYTSKKSGSEMNLDKYLETLPQLSCNNTQQFATSRQKIIKGLCTCGKCRLCHLQKQKMGLGPNAKSLYKVDYPEHPLQTTNKFLPKDSNTMKIPGANYMGNESTHKKDFKDPGRVYNESCRPDNISNSNGIQMMGAPFSKFTNYKNDYIDWEQKEPIGIIKPSDLDRSKFKLPFYGKASNREYGNFAPEDVDAPLNGAAKFGKPRFANPLAPKSKFNGDTIYKGDYIPFELDEEDGVQHKPANRNNIQNAKNFPGRFRSTYDDYNNKLLNRNKDCPAKKVLKKVQNEVNKLGLTESFKF